MAKIDTEKVLVCSWYDREDFCAEFNNEKPVTDEQWNLLLDKVSDMGTCENFNYALQDLWDDIKKD